ncbi:MAG: hypothetical protein ACXVYV_03385 [Gaiellales bacterium]
MTGSSSLFAAVIEDHLALKRRNSHLDDELPLEEFVGSDPFENHPLFKTEEDARREEEETGEHPAVALEIPADTLAMQSVPESSPANAPQGWMETTTSPDFNWD